MNNYMKRKKETITIEPKWQYKAIQRAVEKLNLEERLNLETIEVPKVNWKKFSLKIKPGEYEAKFAILEKTDHKGKEVTLSSLNYSSDIRLHVDILKQIRPEETTHLITNTFLQYGQEWDIPNIRLEEINNPDMNSEGSELIQALFITKLAQYLVHEKGFPHTAIPTVGDLFEKNTGELEQFLKQHPDQYVTQASGGFIKYNPEQRDLNLYGQSMDFGKPAEKYVEEFAPKIRELYAQHMPIETVTVYGKTIGEYDVTKQEIKDMKKRLK